jgi:hypothetical protein
VNASDKSGPALPVGVVTIAGRDADWIADLKVLWRAEIKVANLRIAIRAADRLFDFSSFCPTSFDIINDP